MMKPILQPAVISSLSPLENFYYEHALLSFNGNKERALEIVVNTVEGDDSQLSDLLADYAKQQGWLNGF